MARARAIEVGGEAYQRGFNIVKQNAPHGRWRVFRRGR